MFRSAFSMIELVFVIVILGILSAVAIPKFSSIQDDALISNEKTTIGIVRQGIVMLYGQRLIRGKDFTKTLTDINGADYDVNVSFTSKYYPTTLDVKTVSSSTDNNQTSLIKRGERKAFALVVEPEGLADWSRTALIGNISAGKFQYSGPASNVITDKNAEISNSNYWEYNNTSGKILKK